ncbi:MAG: hypothetical protein LBP51_04950 [Deferribacteraceae bacterium]|nr:hypothetical protein [Deferribacteraceae bacterium]
MRVFAAIFIILLIQTAYSSEFYFLGEVDWTLGVDNDLDFNKNTSESPFFNAFLLKLREDAYLPYNFGLTAEVHLKYNDGDDGNPYSSYNADNDEFKVRNASIKWDCTGINSRIRAGIQPIELPSATFGNPLFSGYINALNISTIKPEKVYWQLFIASPIQNNDRMPKANSAVIGGGILDFIGENFEFAPYFIAAYLKHQEDSTFDWASAPNNAHSYLLGGGAAAKYNFNKNISAALDLVIADTNNSGPHHYENKGYFSAALLEYDIHSGLLGLFGWYSSGNSSKLQNHNDYGLLPTMAGESSFHPTRLAFKGDISEGRDAAVSENSAGTAGIGVHLKQLRFLSNLEHIFRLAYITGTSTDQGAGAPAAVIVESYAKKRGEPAVMTDKDYALEIDFDSVLDITDCIRAALEIAYIFSGYADKRYDTDIYNVELSIRYIF